MAKFTAQLKDRFLGLVGRITSCGRGGHNDHAATESKLASVQHNQIRTRSTAAPRVPGGSQPQINEDAA